ncbi:MAG: 3-oxoacyl-ACP synthase III [Zetaproteobacteria bacterium]|nr:3-oxoacyl-ACP synthase III [Pseudobdellovibrionaceae bacterium]
MRFSEVCLESFGYHLPDDAISSDQIEKQLFPLYQKIGCEQGQLEKMTGISERKIWPTGTLPSSVATVAGKKALENSSLKPSEIDLIVFTGVCRDSLEPSTANVIHHNLELSPHCLTFDISNACIGFLNGVLVASNMIESGQINSAMIMTGENAGPLYEYTIPKLLEENNANAFRKSLASLTLGSGATAFLLSRKKQFNTKPLILGGTGMTDSSGHALCKGNGNVNQLQMETDTTGLMKQGLALTASSWEKFKKEMEWDNDTPSHILTHQISRSHHEKCFSLLNIDPKKGYSFLKNMGNTGSAGAPLSLALEAEKNTFKKDEYIALLGIGSGINTMMLGIVW